MSRRAPAERPAASPPWGWIAVGVAVAGVGFLIVRQVSGSPLLGGASPGGLTGLPQGPAAGGAASSETVRTAQQRLLALHYNLGPYGADGKIGSAGSYTRRAIASFQSSRGLPATGDLTAPTLTALGVS